MLNGTQGQDVNLQELIRREIDSVLLDDDGSAGYSLDDPLLAAGLNSLLLAQLLIQLETELGVDPFAEDRSIADIRTVRDLVTAYEEAIQASPTGA